METKQTTLTINGDKTTISASGNYTTRVELTGTVNGRDVTVTAITRPGDERNRFRSPRVYVDGLTDDRSASKANIEAYKNEITAVLAELGVHAGKVRFSAKAGCSCPCSPGFIVDGFSLMNRLVEVPVPGSFVPDLRNEWSDPCGTRLISPHSSDFWFTWS
jgi:hypothetical protein